MATRFHFRLEPLLKLRKSLEQEARRQLAKTLATRNEAEAHLKELEQQHREGVASRRSDPGQEIDLTFWADLERFLVVLEKRIIQAREDLETAEQLVVQARQVLTRAHQDHLMLLRLKERRKEQHDLEAFHEEIREADEIAVLRHRFTEGRSTRSSAP
jgi:flagellar FliJ protein